MKKLHVLTNSEVETYRLCSAKHGYAYQELLRPRSEGHAKPSGSILHAGLAAGWWAAWEEPDSLDGRLQRAIAAAAKEIATATQAECLRLAALGGEGSDDVLARLEEEAPTLTWCTENYFRAIRPDLGYVPVSIEGEFMFRVPTDRGNDSLVQYRGKRDLVLWDDEANRLIVQDHKGTSRGVREMERKLPLDTQLSGYVYGLKLQRSVAALVGESTPPDARRVIGEHRYFPPPQVGSVALNVIRRKRPETPNVNLLKKGEAVTELQRQLLDAQTSDGQHRGLVSVADCDTTSEIYGDALSDQVVERGLPITDKQRERLAIITRKAGFFAQLEQYRDEVELERWRKELLWDAAKIRADARSGHRTRNPGACAQPWSPPCAYAGICERPTDPVARAQYVVVDRPHQELEQQHGIEEEQNDYI